MRTLAGFAAVLFTALACMTPNAAGGVRAVRFRQLIHEGVVDYMHGGGRWHDEIYLPEAGVSAWVTWEPQDGPGPQVPVIHTRRTTLAAALAARPQDDTEGRIPPEDIIIPMALAARIVAVADTAERQRAIAEQLAADAVSAAVVGDESSVHWREGWRD